MVNEDLIFNQFTIAGFKNGKWYREGKFKSLEEAKQYLEEHINSNPLKNYDKFKFQMRKISKWEDVEDEKNS